MTCSVSSQGGSNTSQACCSSIGTLPYDTALLQERERDSLEELEEAKQQAQTATHAFNAVRQARYDTFMKAFNHISAGIDRIFKVSSVASVCAMGFSLMCSTSSIHLGQCLQVSLS